MFFRRVRLKFFVIAISPLHDLVTMVIHLPSPLPLSFSPACLQAMYPYSEQGSGWSASLGSCSYSPLRRQIFQPTISPETKEATLNTSDLFLPCETPFFGLALCCPCYMTRLWTLVWPLHFRFVPSFSPRRSSSHDVTLSSPDFSYYTVYSAFWATFVIFAQNG